jgi:opacity protein-like surface antigen
MSRGALNGLARGMGILGLAVLAAGAVEAADITGRQGLGGSVGTSLLIGDWEYRTHARPRFTGDAIFKYGFRPRWAFVGNFGYGWNSYTDEETWLSSPDYADLRESLHLGRDPVEKVTVICPFTAGLEYRFGKDVWVPYVGAGAGIYQLNLYFNGRVAEDPRTLADHRTYNFGFYGRIGAEQFLSESVAMDYEALGHVLFSSDRDKFPFPNSADLATYGQDFHAYGGDAQFLQVRIGLRYYWGGKGEEVKEGAEGETPGTETPVVTPESATPAPTTPAPAAGAAPAGVAPTGAAPAGATPAVTTPGEVPATEAAPPGPPQGTPPPAEVTPPEVAPPAEPEITPPAETPKSAPPDTTSAPGAPKSP